MARPEAIEDAPVACKAWMETPIVAGRRGPEAPRSLSRER